MPKTVYNRRVVHSYRRSTPDYPSAQDTGCSTHSKPAKAYSGQEVIGIATLHKSNAIPVTSGICTNPKLHKGGT